ncbi:hypothetical protein Z517_07846 [Fonsecaea pedrosoi CBS 271.37]|uniref:CHK kinase-like domain-containing protein n=1 Tax=Fonsecaea pedrosoi CBS 271.37 TaxID=1442368 RepID=A0A0D2GBN6_9EURO|nr:uncharacterized protein Z517_07846 [Fonsecaea pedrosoi CBS 271.37]KIW78013.1 hypothetical protein Z517_07846 [Fonsecaea pedrosoi CBS 271.37]
MTIAIPHSAPMPPGLNDLLAGGTVSKSVLINGANTGLTAPEEEEEVKEKGEEEDHCLLNGAAIIPLKRPEDLTSAWLGSFLGRNLAEDGFLVNHIGQGHMSNTVRVDFHEADQPHRPQSVVVKFAKDDAAIRGLGLKFGHYLREAIFYRHFGDLLAAALPLCYGAVVDKDAWFTIVLENLSIHGSYSVNQILGTDYEHAALALKTLAMFQAPLLGTSPRKGDEWLLAPPALDQNLFSESLPAFRAKYKLEPEHDRLLDWMDQNLDAWWATRDPPFSLFHADYRLDNIIFLPRGDRRAAVIDWGGVSWASPLRDVAYFLGNGLTVEDRRRWEKDLVRVYLDEMNRLSKVKMTWDHAWTQYRLAAIYGLAQHIPAAAIEEPTDHIKAFFNTLVPRQAQHALDMDATSLVRPHTSSISATVGDESQQIPPDGSGPMWSESWYFDCVSSDGELGFYGRLGRLPNQQTGTFFGGILRRNKDPIVFVNMDAALPTSDVTTQTLWTDRFTVESRCLDPLKRFALTVRGTGAAFSDPSAPFHGGTGVDVDDVVVDLVWDTAGIPYQKRGLTRYEFPCRVSGTVKIGAECLSVQNAPGERNHSWGVRNWWVADWVWSGLHFSDGMDVFTIALGRGRESSGACGAIQENGKLTEITSVVNEFDPADTGAPSHLTLRIEPGDLVIECEMIGQVGLRLLDQDGRETHLPRAMCRARTNRGQTGVGWLDFNIVVKKEPDTASGVCGKRRSVAAGTDAARPAKIRATTGSKC